MSRSSQTGSSVFSNNTKLEVTRLAGPNCWACNGIEPHFANVFAQSDTQVGHTESSIILDTVANTFPHVQKEVWEHCKLISFSYSSSANSIPLCPSCHAQFDNAADPGFVFFPEDLTFFIEYELRDRQRRQGSGGPRRTPSASEYKDHQVRERKLSSTEAGGLYRRIYLKNYINGGVLPLNVLEVFATDKVWHGDPIASIRRAVAILGSPRIDTVDAKTVCELQTIQKLYFAGSANPIVAQLNHRERSKRPRDDTDEDDEMNKRQKDQTRSRDGHNAHRPGDGADQKQTLGTAKKPPGETWVLGPEFTTEMAVKRFSPVFYHPNIARLLSN